MRFKLYILIIHTILYKSNKNVINSNEIFEYSNDFLEEITNNLLKLKSKKTSNPSNNEFDIQLKALIGKNFNEQEYSELVNSNDEILKNRLKEKFLVSREERVKILEENKAFNKSNVEKFINFHKKKLS